MTRRLLFVLLATLALTLRVSASTLTVQIDPPQAGVGDEVTVTFTVQNGGIGKIVLPAVEGLQVQPGASTMTSLTFSSGTLTRSTSESFRVVPMHSGDFTIPAFDIATPGGEVLHGKALKLHVLAVGEVAATPAQAAPTPAPLPPAPASGPVVMPPGNPAIIVNPNDATSGPLIDDPYASVPKDADGGPAKVFMLIRPQVTDVFVGQAVPIEINFYIREESNADQNSLPTIKGSDFLMNNYSNRGRGGDIIMVENVQYIREIWISAIAAPKSGDFPLAVERDTYWVKSTSNDTLNSLAGFFSRHQNLAHEMITSNQLTMHVHPLPDEGRPEHFSGAIGQFMVTGAAAPTNVSMGEPVKLSYSVTGVGNFDYVRCPVLADDPAWKTYVPTAQTRYYDDSRTHGMKTFAQSVVAQKNGVVALPTAVFSYFDPAAKKYVTTPIPLPPVTVSGALTSAPATPETSDSSAAIAVAPKPTPFLANRPEMGTAFASLTPIYSKPWFWQVQAGLLGVAFLGGVFFLLRPRVTDSSDRDARARLHSSQQQEEQAMVEAVQRNDALAFFTAARHAVQLQLGSQWRVPPEALTLGEIRQRDAALAETLQPLFHQADEVIYSGRADAQVDLAHWHGVVREILQPQAVTA